jgi:hypothetical protein
LGALALHPPVRTGIERIHMKRRDFILLALLGVALLIIVAVFQSAPGYMDANYYYAGGVQLAKGHGFSEPYLWNYLDDPVGLPHPSFAYWMPLASLLTAAGGILFGPTSWTAGRMGFLLVGGAIPPLTAALAWSLTHRRDLAIISGLLAVFPAFYLPFLPVTDTFGLYMALGAVFFLLNSRFIKFGTQSGFPWISLLLGFTTGLMHLTRTDGILWLLLAVGVSLIAGKSASSWRSRFIAVLAVLGGYLLIMGPWFIRNAEVFGSPFGPGSLRMLWLTRYDQLFAYPAETLSFAAWWRSGLAAILKARTWALGINLERTLAEQGEIFLLPLIGVGIWHLRKEKPILLACLAWLLTLGLMTVVFPFAGARGGFFHSGAALQPMWWALAPIGLDRLIEWVRVKRGWDARQAGLVFRPALVGLAVLLTGTVLVGKLLGGPAAANSTSSSSAPGAILTPRGGETWSLENYSYTEAYLVLLKSGVLPNDVVMAADPPGFYLASGLSIIAVPDGTVDTLLKAADRYGAKFLILEETSTPAGLANIYTGEETSPRVILLQESGSVQVYQLLP